MKTLFGCVALLAMSMTMAARAQNHCGDTDTIDSCIENVQAFVNKSVAQSAQDKQVAAEKTQEARTVAEDGKQLLAGKNTGDASASTINDFLPLLRALVDTGGFSQEDGKIGFEWSNPLGLPSEHQNKVIVTLAQSELYEPVKEALRAASLADQIPVLEDRIDEGDDISIGFSYARASRTYGRDPELHQAMFSSLLNLADVPSKLVSEANKRRTDLEAELGLEDGLDGPFTEVAEPRRAEYIRAVEEAALAQFDSMRALGKRLHNVGFYGLLDLINNQPQLSVTADYRARDDAIGADEFKAVISYEMGWYNVNTFRGYAKDNGCGDTQVLCLADYLARESVIDALKESRRITFKAEYSRRKRLDFALAGTAFTYTEEPNERLSISAAFGRYLGKEVAGRTRPRVDASLSYEDYSDDPVRQNRGLATATFTYPVAEGFFLSIGAVYATKPEFRGDVDEELSARAGIVYKVIQDK